MDLYCIGILRMPFESSLGLQALIAVLFLSIVQCLQLRRQYVRCSFMTDDGVELVSWIFEIRLRMYWHVMSCFAMVAQRAAR